MTGDKARNDNHAALETKSNVQEEQMELEDKIRMLKEEFNSLPRVLIKKTLCDYAVDGDLTRAKQRLMEFRQQFKDQGNCFLKNPGGAGRVVGNVNRELNNSPAFRLTKTASIQFEEQSLPGRGNTMRRLMSCMFEACERRCISGFRLFLPKISKRQPEIRLCSQATCRRKAAEHNL